jgi:hypothetical protein
MAYKNKKDLYANQMRRWKRRKSEAISAMGGKCSNCGYSKCEAALEFHHNNPDEKDFDWNKLRLRSWASIIKELSKCKLLCANCHREIHYNTH